MNRQFKLILLALVSLSFGIAQGGATFNDPKVLALIQKAKQVAGSDSDSIDIAPLLKEPTDRLTLKTAINKTKLDALNSKKTQFLKYPDFHVETSEKASYPELKKIKIILKQALFQTEKIERDAFSNKIQTKRNKTFCNALDTWGKSFGKIITPGNLGTIGFFSVSLLSIYGVMSTLKALIAIYK